MGWGGVGRGGEGWGGGEGLPEHTKWSQLFDSVHFQFSKNYDWEIRYFGKFHTAHVRDGWARLGEGWEREEVSGHGWNLDV